MISGRDTSFELRKFEVVSVTGEKREQLGLAGVVAGEVVTIISGDDLYGTSWIVESSSVSNKDGVLQVIARPV
jgi:hypothetical protein